MAELKGKGGELRFTVEVKRAATGKVETYQMIGKVSSHECNTLNRRP
jgi:hypothetical protein